MVQRRRRPIAPHFRVPPPFNPISGQYAHLGQNVDLTRVAVLQVLEEHDDYLICRGYDPERQKFFNSIPVAKPYLLMRTPWDGRTVTLPEDEVTYTYVEPDPPPEGEIAVSRERTADYKTGGSFVEKIEPPYFVGDVLVCAKPRSRCGDNPGSPTGPDVGVDELERDIVIHRTEPEEGEERGTVIEWVDLNAGGRWWNLDKLSTTWLELAANLDADGEANANPLEWDAATNTYTVDTSTTVKAKDFTGMTFGLDGERVRATYRYTEAGTGTKYYEVLETGASWHRATLTADLAQGGSATADVTVGGATVAITVYDAFLGTGESLANGSGVGVEYDLEAKHWTVVQAAC